MKHSSTLSSEDTSSNKQEENSKRFHSPFRKGKNGRKSLTQIQERTLKR